MKLPDSYIAICSIWVTLTVGSIKLDFFGKILNGLVKFLHFAIDQPDI